MCVCMYRERERDREREREREMFLRQGALLALRHRGHEVLEVLRDLWVFITGGCSGRGVQWMGVVLYNRTAYTIM